MSTIDTQERITSASFAIVDASSLFLTECPMEKRNDQIERNYRIEEEFDVNEELI